MCLRRARDLNLVIVVNESARGVSQRPTCQYTDLWHTPRPQETSAVCRRDRVRAADTLQPAQRLIRESHCSGAGRRTAHGAARAAAPVRQRLDHRDAILNFGRCSTANELIVGLTLLLQCALSEQFQAAPVHTGTHLNFASRDLHVRDLRTSLCVVQV